MRNSAAMSAIPVSAPAAPATPLLRGGLLQRLRIGSGLVLFTFALFHFLNHALGIWSIEAMDAMQEWRTAITRSWLGSAILAAALLTHIGLNLWKIARRSTWRLPFWEAIQIALGLTIPLLLFVHLAQMRGHHILLDQATRYSETLPGLWNQYALRQTLLLLVVWLHGCIGLHFWLRLSPLYRRLAPALFALAVVIPTLALAGFAWPAAMRLRKPRRRRRAPPRRAPPTTRTPMASNPPMATITAPRRKPSR